MKAVFNMIGLVALLYLVSCTEEISVDIRHEPHYLVFGSMSNVEQPVSISITRSIPVNSKEKSLPVNDALVSLYAQKDSEEPTLLTNEFTVDRGVYTSVQPISGIVGVSYWIEVSINDDNQFVSTKEKMKKVVPIVDISYESFNQVKVLFTDPVDQRNYYLLESDFINNGHVFNKTFAIYDDAIFNGNKAAVDLDIFYKPVNDNESLDVVLSSINYSSYQFHLNRWKQKEDSENNQADDSGGNPGPLFSAPPVNLYGNIRNDVDGKRVLGNFTIQAIQKESMH
jgi:hypothetical protein